MGSTFHVGKQALVLRKIADEAFDGSSYLVFKQSARQLYDFELPAASMSLSVAASYHSILAHEHYSLNFFPFRPQTFANLMHLLRADIVDRNDEYRLVPILE